jgi:putative transposase
MTLMTEGEPPVTPPKKAAEAAGVQLAKSALRKDDVFTNCGKADNRETPVKRAHPLLPDRGERGREIEDKRRTVNGILWVLRTGAPWRDMPERYDNWNSVFVRFTRWSKLGVWDAAFETLASLGPPADEEHAIDSTIVRAHQHAAGVKGGIKIRKRSAARAADSRPKSTSARTPKATR